jgi:chromosome segregation ATPase
MKFLDDIFPRKRKAEPMPQVMELARPETRDALEELQTSITMHSAKLSKMQSERDGLNSQLQRIGSLSAALKVRISERDAAAAVQLDQLETEARAIERSAEGLKLRIASAEAELRPMVIEASTLAAQRDQQRQDQVVRDIEAERDRLVAEILDSWERACESAYDLTSLLDPGRAGEIRLDKEHANALLRMASEMGTTLQVASLQHVNHQNEFEIRHASWFRVLVIQPLRRKKQSALAG